MNNDTRNTRTNGNLKIWVGSLGFVTVTKLPPAVEVDESPVLSAAFSILTLSSSSSPCISGRTRAIILIFCVDITTRCGCLRGAGKEGFDIVGGGLVFVMFKV